MTDQTSKLTAGIARWVPGITVDGNDVMAVDEAAARLVAEVRGGKGPRLLHVVTRKGKLAGIFTATDACREFGKLLNERRGGPDQAA